MRWLVFGLCVSLAIPAAAAAQEAVSAELIKLHDDLHLSPDQEAAWDAYARAIAPSGQGEARHNATGQLLPMVPTPRRLALLEANMAQDEADFRRQADVVLGFYNRLTPSQQRTFDRDTVPTPPPADGPQESDQGLSTPPAP
jgi:hypothetical protein